jgi:REP element-mobilizing transposase RayT
MSEKFKGKYRIASARMQNWDYASNGTYFITICTKDREHFFGEMINGKLKISPVGAIAYVLWKEIKNHAKNIELGEFIVMPNHVHGILILNDDDLGKMAGDAIQDRDSKDDGDKTRGVETTHDVETTHALSLLPQPSSNHKNIGKKRFQDQGKNSISSIVGSYKSAVTKYCNQLELDMGWQSRFHDHIIRDEDSFQSISDYIINNPKNWSTDKFF